MSSKYLKIAYQMSLTKFKTKFGALVMILQEVVLSYRRSSPCNLSGRPCRGLLWLGWGQGILLSTILNICLLFSNADKPLEIFLTDRRRDIIIVC